MIEWGERGSQIPGDCSWLFFIAFTTSLLQVSFVCLHWQNHFILGMYKNSNYCILLLYLVHLFQSLIQPSPHQEMTSHNLYFFCFSEALTTDTSTSLLVNIAFLAAYHSSPILHVKTVCEKSYLALCIVDTFWSVTVFCLPWPLDGVCLETDSDLH